MKTDVSLTESFLFRGVRESTAALAAGCAPVCVQKGGEIPSGALGFVLSGTVKAVGTAQKNAPILSSFRPGDFFGMASLFGGICGATRLLAAESCRVLLLPQELVERLLAEDAAFACNYAAFLTQKLRFLNRKIAAFTAGSTERTLARYLLSLPVEGDCVVLPLRLCALADALCIARSSLYRAFDALEAGGLVHRQAGCVRFSSREEFQTLYGGL